MSSHQPDSPAMSDRAPTDRRFRFKVAGMDCGSCARTIEKGIAELDGVSDVTVNFTAEMLEGRGKVSDADIERRVEALGYRLADAEARLGDSAETQESRGGFFRHVWRQVDTRIALIGGSALLLGLPLLSWPADSLAGRGFAALQLAVIAIVGYPIAVRGIRSLVYARQITINLLMTAATIGAIAIGAYGEAATVVLLYTLGEALEAYSADRSRRSLRSLLKLRPETATVIVEDVSNGDANHRHYQTHAVAMLIPGDHVLVKPGERVTADGLIVEGESGIDESAISGESIPVHKGIGDEVRAGTINGAGTLVIEVSRKADDFTIAQIAKLVEKAQADRSPAERFIDRFAQWYTPAVVVLAVLVAAVPPLAFGQPFLNPAGSTGWFYRGLALLIVACPCALIISIPVTVVSALARLASLGILVKGGAQLSELAATRVFAFDKTGTLTYGRPTVAGLRSRDCAHDDSSLQQCAPCDELVAVAAAVEHGSSHPLAHAVVSTATERNIQHRYERATGIVSHAGRGVSGTVNGQRITVGHEALFDRDGSLDGLLASRSSKANSRMIVGDEADVLGVIDVADQLRPDAKVALESLRRIDRDYRFVMLTGDSRGVADAIGNELGQIDEVHAELLPEQKLDAIHDLERSSGNVAMIGDGINDTPALAGSQLGVAMGGAGSHQAMEVADVVLMKDELTQLPLAVSIARRTRRLVSQNIALSLGLKLLFLGLAIPGLATLWMAVLADVGTTLLVTLNGMRMLRAK